MFAYFPKIYPDELLYSVFMRYHKHTGNQSLFNSSKEFFGRQTHGANNNFPSNLKYICDKLPEHVGISTLDIIYNNTILPIFIPFVPKQRIEKAIVGMQSGDSRSVLTTLGITAGGVFDINILKYCSKCKLEDKLQYGEAYFHRLHQVPGNFVCHKHRSRLKTILPNEDLLSINMFDIDNDSKSDDLLRNEFMINEFYILANDILTLINNHEATSFEITKQKYDVKMKEKEYMSPTGLISQTKLHQDFSDYYSSEFLNVLMSNISVTDENSWLRTITRKKIKVVHPIRHLIFIRFLFGSIENFINYNKTEYIPFGKGPWPCLNDKSDHYRDYTVHAYQIKTNHKTGKPQGTFTCNLCGCTYSRTGPDVTKEDIYKKTKTLSKGFGNNVSSNLNPINNRYDTSLEIPYKNKIIKIINEDPHLSRRNIIKKAKNEYRWLYKHHKEWLEERIPKPLTSKEVYINNRVNWDQRDQETSENVIKAINNIKNSNFIERLTIQSISRNINYTRLPSDLSKMPKTKKILRESVEEIEEYHKRKIKIIIQREIKDQLPKHHIILRSANISGKYYNNYTEYIDTVVNEIKIKTI